MQDPVFTGLSNDSAGIVTTGMNFSDTEYNGTDAQMVFEPKLEVYIDGFLMHGPTTDLVSPFGESFTVDTTAVSTCSYKLHCRVGTSQHHLHSRSSFLLSIV